MKDPAQDGLIRAVTEDVVRITQKYGGLLWGEHGKGVRSEFSPRFFGPLYPTLQAIKAAFDPRNQLNPGKIAAPEDGALLTDRRAGHAAASSTATIPAPVRAAYDEALHCNGNGACFSWDPDEAMCPSYKVDPRPPALAQGPRLADPRMAAATGRPRLRPGGGSRLAAASPEPGAAIAARLRNTRPPQRGEPDFSHEVKDAMDGCLACKSCTGQCPIKVDVPTFRAKFLELYHSRYLAAPARLPGGLAGSDAAGHRQAAAAVQSRARQPARVAPPCGRSGSCTRRSFSPISMRRELAARGHRRRDAAGPVRPVAGGARAQRGPGAGRVHQLVRDADRVLAVLDLMQAIGFRPFVAPFRPNGKPLHVHGFLGAFARAATRNAAHAAGAGSNRRGARRRRHVHDADLPLGIRHAAGGRPAAARAACCRSGWRATWTPSRARRQPGGGFRAAAALLGARARRCQPARLAGGVRRGGRELARAAVRLLRHGRNLRPRSRAPGHLRADLRDELGTACRRMGRRRASAGDRLFLPLAGQDHRRADRCRIPRKRCSRCLRGG